MSSREIKGKILIGGEQAVEAVSDLLKNKVVTIATVKGRKDMMQYYNITENEDVKREFFSDEGLSELIGKSICKLIEQGTVVYRLKWSGDNGGSTYDMCTTFSCKLDELKLLRQKKIVEAMFEILVRAGVVTRNQSSEVFKMSLVELRAYMLGLDYHEPIKGNDYWRKWFALQIDYLCKQYEIIVA